MIKYIKYLLVFLLATGFVACSEDEGAQILGGLYENCLLYTSDAADD